MKKIFNWLKKNKVLSITILIGIIVFLIPKIIDWSYLYYKGNPNTTFSSSDILNFWGTLVGGAVVLIGVFVTILHSDKKTKEIVKKSEKDRVNQIKPNLVSEYQQVYSSNFIKESDIREEFIIVNLNDDEYPMYNSPTAPTWLDFSRTKDNVMDTFLALQHMKKYLCILYTLTNYGGETALDIETLVNGLPALPNFSLGKHQSKVLKFIFVFEKVEPGEEKNINIQYTFTNIDSSTTYIAKESFTVFKDNNYSLSSKQHPNDFIKTEELKEDTHE